MKPVMYRQIAIVKAIFSICGRIEAPSNSQRDADTAHIYRKAFLAMAKAHDFVTMKSQHISMMFLKKYFTSDLKAKQICA